MYRQFNGVVLAEQEGKNIAEALGSKKVYIYIYIHIAILLMQQL